MIAFIAGIKFKKNEMPAIKVQAGKDSLKNVTKKKDKVPKVENMDTLLKRPKQDKPKLILVWKILHGQFKKFHTEKCPVNNCETTLDRSKVNKSDVIVFSGRYPVEFPKNRPEGQIWIFQQMESQVGIILVFSTTSHENLTATSF